MRRPCGRTWRYRACRRSRPGPMLLEQADACSTPDRAIAEAPDCPAVFLIWPVEGEPYLAKTSLLRRRLNRLLKAREKPSRLLNLRDTAARVEWWISGSALE